MKHFFNDVLIKAAFSCLCSVVVFAQEEPALVEQPTKEVPLEHSDSQNKSENEEIQKSEDDALNEIIIEALPARKKPVISEGSPFIADPVQQLSLNEDFQEVFFDVRHQNRSSKFEIVNNSLGLNLDEQTGVVYFTPTREDEIGTHSILFTVKHRGKSYEHQVDFIIASAE